MSAATLSEASKSYLRLAAIWPPHVPRDDDDYETAAELTRSVTAGTDEGKVLDEGEAMYVEAVFTLLETFDERHGHFDWAADLPPAERLRGLMEDAGSNPADMAEIAGVDEATVAEALAGRRDLPVAAIRRLAEHFHLEAGYFI